MGYKKGDFPVTEKVANEIFSLPMYTYMNDEDQEKIVSYIVWIFLWYIQ